MEEPISSPPAPSKILPPAPRDSQVVVGERITLVPVDAGMRLPTLRDFAAVLFRHKGLLVFSFLAIFLGVVLGTYIMPKQYESRKETGAPTEGTHR